eukprot:4472432-Prymnesium_polylepis.2
MPAQQRSMHSNNRSAKTAGTHGVGRPPACSEGLQGDHADVQAKRQRRRWGCKVAQADRSHFDDAKGRKRVQCSKSAPHHKRRGLHGAQYTERVGAVATPPLGLAAE